MNYSGLSYANEKNRLVLKAGQQRLEVRLLMNSIEGHVRALSVVDIFLFSVFDKAKFLKNMHFMKWYQYDGNVNLVRKLAYFFADVLNKHSRYIKLINVAYYGFNFYGKVKASIEKSEGVMSKVKSVKIMKVLALALLAMTITVARVNAQSMEETMGHESPSGIKYLAGGVGNEESDYFNKVSRDYNLHVMFSHGRTNGYVVDVNLTVEDQNGVVLSLDKVGPLVYIKLPAGRYELSASLEGHVIHRKITVGKKALNAVNFNWRHEDGSSAD